MNSKICSSCKIEKTKEYFSKNKNTKDGLCIKCKLCSKEYAKNYYYSNREKHILDRRQYRQDNKEKCAETCKKSYSKNRDKKLAYRKEYCIKNKDILLEKNKERHIKYYSQNKSKFRAKDSKRRALEMRAIPKWADLEKIKEIYLKCQLLCKQTGIKYVVDHYYPLTSCKVSGLHVHTNLRIITASENSRKHNKLPEEFYINKKSNVFKT